MPGYTYDFTTRPHPTTDDPRWEGRLTHGPHNRVLLGGVDVGGHVRRCQIGEAGWVEVAVTGPGGKPVQEIYLLETGVVVVRSDHPSWADRPRLQVKLQGPDGAYRDKYGERLTVEVLRGYVEYVPVALEVPADYARAAG